MRVRILSFVVMGLLMVAPLSSWALCAEIDPDGVCLDQTAFSLGPEPGFTTSSSRSSHATQAPTDRTEKSRGDAVSAETLVGVLLHWLADLMPSV